MPIECSHAVMETVESSSFILDDTNLSFRRTSIVCPISLIGKAPATTCSVNKKSNSGHVHAVRHLELPWHRTGLSNTQILQIRFSIHWPNHFRWNEPVKLLEAYQMQKFQRRVSKYHGHCQYVHLAAFNLCKLQSKLSTCLWHHWATFDCFQSLSLFWFSHACMHVCIYKLTYDIINNLQYNLYVTMFFSCNLV